MIKKNIAIGGGRSLYLPECIDWAEASNGDICPAYVLDGCFSNSSCPSSILSGLLRTYVTASAYYA